MRRGQWEKALAALLRAVELKPTDAFYWLQLGEIYCQLKYEDYARAMWREAFRREPYLKTYVGSTALLQLRQSYPVAKAGQRAVQTLLEETRASTQSNRHPTSVQRQLLSGTVGSLPEWLFKKNLQAFIVQAVFSNVKIGLLTYPKLPPQSPVNKIIRDVAASTGVLLIDANYAFSKFSQKATPRLFSSDHLHPNADGYELLAGCVLKRIVDSGVLDGAVGKPPSVRGVSASRSEPQPDVWPQRFVAKNSGR